MTNYYQPSNPYAALGNGGGPTLLDSVASGSKMFNELAGQQAQRDLAGGDQSAMQRLQAYQPENASKLAYANYQQQEAAKKQMDNQGKLFEATYQAVTSAKDPEAKKQAYETMLALNKTYGVPIPNLPDLQQYTPNTEATLASLRSIKQSQMGFEGKSWSAQMANKRMQDLMRADPSLSQEEAMSQAMNDVVSMPKEYYNAQTGPTVTQSTGFTPTGGASAPSTMTPPLVASRPLTPSNQSLVPTAAIDQNEYMDMPPPKNMVGDASNVTPNPRPDVPDLASAPDANTTPTVAKKTQIENEMSNITQQMEQAKTLPIREQSVAMSSLNAKKANLQSEYDKVQKRYDLLAKQQGDYSEKVDKSNLGELVGTFTALRSDLDKLGDNVPGTGIDSFKPDVMLSPEAIDMRQKMMGLGNVILKARSGGAVTNSEATRAMGELGISFDTDDQGVATKILNWKPTKSLKSGIENFGRQIQDRVANLEGGVDKEAIQLYKSNGGTTTLDKLAIPAPKDGHVIEGRIYKTPDGLWKFDGTNMVKLK